MRLQGAETVQYDTVADAKDLSVLLDKINKTPFERELYTNALDMALGEERDMLRMLLLENFCLSIEEWKTWIHERQAVASTNPSNESYQAVLDLFERANADLKALSIMQMLVDYVLEEYYTARALIRPDSDQVQMKEAANVDISRQPDANRQSVWSENRVILLLQRTAMDSSCDWAGSEPIWQAVFTFLRDLHLRQPSAALRNRIKDFFLVRLAEPHAQHEQTMEAYSSFTTATDHNHYEQLLVEAQKLYAPARDAYRKREWHESQLACIDDRLSVAYIRYSTWEAKNGEPKNVVQIFERGLAACPLALDLWMAYLRHEYVSLRDMMERGDFDATSELANKLLKLARRAVRFSPSASSTWIALMNAHERVGDLPEVERTFERALSTCFFDKSIDDLVKLFLARADIHRQVWQELMAGVSSLEDSLGFVEVDAVLKDGIKRIKRVNRSGDPQLRLERYLVRFYERQGSMQDAIESLANAAKANKRSFAIWAARADLYTRHEHLTEARATYREALEQFLDYPEYLFDAYITFEHQNGSLHDIQQAESVIASKLRAIENRRQQERDFAKSFALQVTQPDQMTARSDQANAKGDAHILGPPENDSAPSNAVSVSGKRRHDLSEGSSVAKKAKTTHATSTDLKRQREQTTIIALNLPNEVSEEILRLFFAECGPILEVKLFPQSKAATVEFKDGESLLMAITKDKKRIQGDEIDVHAARSSTLWCTNFPEDFDESSIQSLFANHGPILETRWPDKSLKKSRRFCYVTLATEAAATSAISALDGRSLDESNSKLVVAISDPERKGKRSDADANHKEVRVTNLRPSVTSQLLEKIFAECGVVKAVRLDGKGNAFVEYEAEHMAANAVRTINDKEIVGRHISVTRVDPKRGGGPGSRADSHRGKAGKRRSDVQSRSVRLSGLPPHPQSGLIQQALQKIALEVSRIEILDHDQLAIVEFANSASAGRALLLPPGSLVVAGQTLTIEAIDVASHQLQSRSDQAVHPLTSDATTDASLSKGFAPRSQRGRGLGRGGRGGFAKGGRPGIDAKQIRPASSQDNGTFRATFSGERATLSGEELNKGPSIKTMEE